MSEKRKKGGKTQAPRPPLVRSRRPSLAGEDLRALSVRLPAAYMIIIEREGAEMGLSRGQFLTMLVRRDEGRVLLERPPTAPSYTVSEAELTKMVRYMWFVPTQIRERIDQECLRMGNIALAAYLVQLVNSWLGQPRGLPLTQQRTR